MSGQDDAKRLAQQDPEDEQRQAEQAKQESEGTPTLEERIEDFIEDAAMHAVDLLFRAGPMIEAPANFVEKVMLALKESGIKPGKRRWPRFKLPWLMALLICLGPLTAGALVSVYATLPQLWWHDSGVSLASGVLLLLSVAGLIGAQDAQQGESTSLGYLTQPIYLIPVNRSQYVVLDRQRQPVPVRFH